MIGALVTTSVRQIAPSLFFGNALDHRPLPLDDSISLPRSCIARGARFATHRLLTSRKEGSLRSRACGSASIGLLMDSGYRKWTNPGFLAVRRTRVDRGNGAPS